MKTERRLYPVLLAVAILIAAVPARAQMLPVSTTMVLEKADPDRGAGDRQVVTIGIKDQTYNFLLRDAYVDDPSNRVVWPDVWQSVRQFRPNFQAQRADPETFEKLKPGDVVTVKAMYQLKIRSFTIVSVTPGSGTFGPAHNY
jgi:hypothetical protein